MTLAEFKAWFEGFTESIEGKSAPTQKQWARIKEKVGQIDGTPVTKTVYIEKYWRDWFDYRPYWIAGSTTTTPLGQVTMTYGTHGGDHVTYASNTSLEAKGLSVTEPFDSLSAMHALGRAEAVN